MRPSDTSAPSAPPGLTVRLRIALLALGIPVLLLAAVWWLQNWLLARVPESRFVEFGYVAYGFFKTPLGHQLRLTVVTVPAFLVPLGYIVYGLVVGRRLRRIAYTMHPSTVWGWLGTLYAVFLIRLFLLTIQGDASLFI